MYKIIVIHSLLHQKQDDWSCGHSVDNVRNMFKQNRKANLERIIIIYTSKGKYYGWRIVSSQSTMSVSILQLSFITYLILFYTVQNFVVSESLRLCTSSVGGQTKTRNSLCVNTHAELLTTKLVACLLLHGLVILWIICCN